MPIKSPHPDLKIPNVDIFALIFNNDRREYPDDHVLFIDPDTHRSYTFAQCRDATVEFGKGLKAQWNWKKNDVLAIYSPNTIDYGPVVWGCHWAGGTISPANPGYTSKELAFQLGNSGVKALVTQLPFLKVALEACRIVGIPDRRIILMGDKRDPRRKFKHFSDIRNTSHSAQYVRTRVNPKKDLAFLCYSSGTTGLPKGVMLSHSNIVTSILQNAEGGDYRLRWDNRDRVIAFLPFFHIFGLTCLLHVSCYAGITLVVMPSFNLPLFLSHIQTYRITFAYLVPPVVLLLSKSPIVSQYDLSSLRMATCGAAPLTRSLIQSAYARTKVPIKQGYGLSEASSSTHLQAWEDWDKYSGSVGVLLPNMIAKYVSEDGEELPIGQAGELCLKGPNIFLGYHNNPESTKKAFCSDGFCRTGDAGYQDEKGNFYVTDRLKELIKYKGFQVAPAELEGLLVGMEEVVRDVGIAGVWDNEEQTEVPRAWIVLKEGVRAGKDTEQRILDWCHERVSNHKRLRGGVRFVDKVPQTASGKILRRVLRDMVKEEEEGLEKAKL